MIPALNRFTRWTLAFSRPTKQAIAWSSDMGLCFVAVAFAFYLRLGWKEFHWSQEIVNMTVLSVVSATPVFWMTGLYRAIFRYTGMSTMVTVAKAVSIYGLVYAVILTGVSIQGIPRTIGFIQPLLVLVLVSASRVLVRLSLDDLSRLRGRKASATRTLIYGAGSAGRQLVMAMSNSPEVRVVGFLDDDVRLHGHELNGLPIHSPTDLSALMHDLAVTDVLLALPSASRQRRNQILDSLAHLRLSIRTLPDLVDIATGRIQLSDVHDLDINDLLGREPVKPNGVLLHKNTHQKTVVVTGAGGSIGSELCRQILRCEPKTLLLVEMSEFALYQVHQELLGLQDKVKTQVEIIPLLASVCDSKRMHEIMEVWLPDSVYHAAAYKHVPLVEHNPAQGLRNNVWGTWICAQAALAADVENFVLISTDKAVRPTNVMGASKRLAEMVLQALAAQTSNTTFSMVRFGNVLGSSGSVVPLFRQQIRNGGPITVTHLDITRYFMTIPEAAQLVIQAGAMANAGDVFVLDMGQPVRIQDLARRMIELSGLQVRDELNPEGDIAIEVTGLRPGEKLYEELLIGENPEGTQHARIMKARENFLPINVLTIQLEALQTAMQSNDMFEMRKLLLKLVHGYAPTDKVVDWVHMAKREEVQHLSGVVSAPQPQATGTAPSV